jgi:hypothetical protein
MYIQANNGSEEFGSRNKARKVGSEKKHLDHPHPFIFKQTTKARMTPCIL